MGEKPSRGRRGGSLVFPIILIVLGVLFLLSNLNITSGIDWGTIWKLWPILLIAIGLEVILGRRVSFGAVLLIVLIVIIGGAALWWSVVVGTGDRTTEYFTWPMDGVERAEVELRAGVGELQLVGYDDMADLLVADLDLAPGAKVSHDLELQGDVAQGWIDSDRDFFSLPPVIGGKSSQWDLRLNTRLQWEMNVNSGIGDVRLDLSDLKVSDLELNSGIGAVRLTLPRRGTVRARVDGGVGDLSITIPEGVQARIRVDRGLSSLNIDNRFQRQGDYYETAGISGAESFIDLEIDMGIGSITIR
jgi:hypothetical protein